MSERALIFDYNACLRSEYAKNGCDICVDLCPEKAMVFDRNLLRLDAERCTDCGACAGSCPSEAFGHEALDLPALVDRLARQKEPALMCGEGLPCLAVFSSEALAALALKRDKDVALRLGGCFSCALNREGKVLPAIEEAVAEANRFLAFAGFSVRVRVDKSANEAEPKEVSRRDLFKGLIAKRLAKSEPSVSPVNEQKRIPPRRLFLQQALKERAEQLAQTKGRTDFSFVTGKYIDSGLCDNCRECAMFCPTGALTLTSGNDGIIFQVGKCIHCGICNDVCRPRAIGDSDGFDMVTFAFDRAEVLVRHRLEICEECKVAFPYKGGEKLCGRCRDFKANFSDLFTLAKDMA